MLALQENNIVYYYFTGVEILSRHVYFALWDGEKVRLIFPYNIIIMIEYQRLSNRGLELMGDCTPERLILPKNVRFSQMEAHFLFV